MLSNCLIVGAVNWLQKNSFIGRFVMLAILDDRVNYWNCFKMLAAPKVDCCNNKNSKDIW